MKYKVGDRIKFTDGESFGYLYGMIDKIDYCNQDTPYRVVYQGLENISYKWVAEKHIIEAIIVSQPIEAKSNINTEALQKELIQIVHSLHKMIDILGGKQ